MSTSDVIGFILALLLAFVIGFGVGLSRQVPSKYLAHAKLICAERGVTSVGWGAFTCGDGAIYEVSLPK